MDFDFDENNLYRAISQNEQTSHVTSQQTSSTYGSQLATCKEKKKPKVNRMVTIKSLEDYFVESYAQDYFESRNNSILRKFMQEVYRTVYDISSYFDDLKKEALKNKPKNDKLWYEKYKS